jgi:sialidase-1
MWRWNMETKEMLFRAGENGYHAYRIPVVAITDNNTVLAFTEARKNSSEDYATIDLIMKRKPQDGVFSNEIII